MQRSLSKSLPFLIELSVTLHIDIYSLTVTVRYMGSDLASQTATYIPHFC